jgi:hypothetical protein
MLNLMLGIFLSQLQIKSEKGAKKSLLQPHHDCEKIKAFCAGSECCQKAAPSPGHPPPLSDALCVSLRLASCPSERVLEKNLIVLLRSTSVS